VTVEELESQILAIEQIDGVTFSGGEPFCQAGVLAVLAERLHAHGLTVVIYTGYTLEELRAANRPDWVALLKESDLLIDGPYMQELYCNEPFRGSSNQQLRFLTGRIQPGDIQPSTPQAAEFTLDASGTVTATGFPQGATANEAFAEIAAILGGS
jgi:anaerobic ribonucleoside-triphosphate reductase activating protein